MGRRHLFRAKNGRFKRGTLEDLGVPERLISDGRERICAKCGKASRPILTRWTCMCGFKNDQ